jgi:hypothetical protein
MTTPDGKNEPAPEELLDDVLWAFGSPPFTDRAAFDKAVRAYQVEIRDEDTWQPDWVALRTSRVCVRPDEWESELPQPDGWLTADGPEGFTAVELLFKIHNMYTAALGEGDHFYFEGLTLNEDPGEGWPVYDLDTGS